MNKTILPALLVATIMVAGAFAFVPVEQATTVHTSGSVIADQLGSAGNGLDITDEGVISDANAAAVTIADDVTIQDASPLLTFDDTAGAADGSILGDAGSMTFDSDTNVAAGTLVLSSAGDLTLSSVTPKITLDDSNDAGQDGSILADNGVVTIDTDESVTNAGQLIVLGDSVFGTTGNDGFDWITNGADTFNMGTGTGIDTFNIATGAGQDVVNIGTSNAAVNDINLGSSTANFAIQSDAFEVTDAGIISDRASFVDIDDTMQLGTNGDTIASIQAQVTGGLTFGAFVDNTPQCVDSGLAWVGIAATDVIIVNPNGTSTPDVGGVSWYGLQTSGTQISVCGIHDGTENPDDNTTFNILVIEL